MKLMLYTKGYIYLDQIHVHQFGSIMNYIFLMNIFGLSNHGSFDYCPSIELSRTVDIRVWDPRKRKKVVI